MYCDICGIKATFRMVSEHDDIPNSFNDNKLCVDCTMDLGREYKKKCEEDSYFHFFLCGLDDDLIFNGRDLGIYGIN